jgi:hypothetical protein
VKDHAYDVPSAERHFEAARVNHAYGRGLPRHAQDRPTHRYQHALDECTSQTTLFDAVHDMVRETGGPSVSRHVADRPSLSDDAARRLAIFVLDHLPRSLPVDVEDIARSLGVKNVIYDKSLKSAGGLQDLHAGLTILHGSGDPTMRRETIAHELGHLLLRLIEAMPFKAQMGDPMVEHFCDQFARELLVPSSWLSAMAPARSNIEVALEISELTQSTLPTAAAALIDVHQPRGFLLLWRRRRDVRRGWLVSHTIGSKTGTYRSDASTLDVLDGATDASRVVTFTLVRDGRVRVATADVVATDAGVATWIRSLRALTKDDPLWPKQLFGGAL